MSDSMSNLGSYNYFWIFEYFLYKKKRRKNGGHKLMCLPVQWLFNNAFGSWLFKLQHEWAKYKGKWNLMAPSALERSSWTERDILENVQFIRNRKVLQSECEKHWVGFDANYKRNQMKCERRPSKQVCEATAWCEALHTPTRARYYRDISV